MATHAILRTLYSLATNYLDALGEEKRDIGEYKESTYLRIFHCIELFADHPRYKAGLIEPGNITNAYELIQTLQATIVFRCRSAMEVFNPA